MKRPQNHGQIATKGPCQLKRGTCRLPLLGLSQNPLCREREWGICALGKLAEQAFRQSDALSKGSHEPRFLPLLMPRGALESVIVTTALTNM